jgi:hypothetical protein
MSGDEDYAASAWRSYVRPAQAVFKPSAAPYGPGAGTCPDDAILTGDPTPDRPLRQARQHQSPLLRVTVGIRVLHTRLVASCQMSGPRASELPAAAVPALPLRPVLPAPEWATGPPPRRILSRLGAPPPRQSQPSEAPQQPLPLPGQIDDASGNLIVRAGDTFRSPRQDHCACTRMPL